MENPTWNLSLHLSLDNEGQSEPPIDLNSPNTLLAEQLSSAIGPDVTKEAQDRILQVELHSHCRHWESLLSTLRTQKDEQLICKPYHPTTDRSVAGPSYHHWSMFKENQLVGTLSTSAPLYPYLRPFCTMRTSKNFFFPPHPTKT